MKRLRSALLVVLFCVAPIGTGEAEDYAVATETASVRFTCPEGWHAIEDDRIDAFNTRQKESNRFTGGIAHGENDLPDSWTLLQIKGLTPPSDLDTIRKTTPKVQDLASLGAVFADGSWKKSPTYYVEKYDVFVMLTCTDDTKSLMVKRFTPGGYVLFHFYTNGNNAQWFADADLVLSSLWIGAGIDLEYMLEDTRTDPAKADKASPDGK